MDITLTLKCNNNCLFCPRQGYLKTIACVSIEEIYRDIEKTRRVSDEIALSGGEVTLLPDLEEIVGFCGERGFKKVGIITNGRRLKDVKFAQRLIRAGVKDFAVSLYSWQDKIHDAITRKSGSARDTKKGLLNLLRLSRRYPIGIRVNTVLNYWNYRDLPGTIKKLFSYGVRNFIIAEQVVINRKAEHLLAPEIKDALRRISDLTLKNTRLVFRGFPLCFAPICVGVSPEGFILKKQSPRIILEKQEIDTLVKKNSSKNKYLEDFRKLFTRVKKCRDCALEKSCLGMQKAYL
ncbi:MAG: radical SAM protein [Candidatus Omnitrophica bacterium]|nr:radical SAM protein [Candidatus Omnitrophota bacterium]MDD5654058.1 radical SAM protein [Candidatus Omnitrophota bacterium]